VHSVGLLYPIKQCMLRTLSLIVGGLLLENPKFTSNMSQISSTLPYYLSTFHRRRRYYTAIKALTSTVAISSYQNSREGTVRSESRSALSLRYVDLVVIIDVIVAVCCCFIALSC
jgi:hypothetical protein